MGQSPRPLEPRPVEERPVGRTEILDPDTVLPRLEPRVPGGGIFVRGQGDVVLASTTDRQLGRVEVEVHPLLELGALHDDELPRVNGWRGRCDTAFARRRQDEALLRQAEISTRGANDPPDEEIEKDEEGDLQDQQGRIDGDGGDHWRSRSNVILVEPSTMVSPSLSFARLTRLPLTSVPFVDPKSMIQ